MSNDLLIDTHVVLWLLHDDARWRPLLDGRLDNPGTTISVSAVTYLEIAIKHSIGKLDIGVGSARQEARRSGILELPVTGAHAEQLERLPLHHRDPFDRTLAAQAMSEGMTLVTTDRAFDAYDGLELLGR